MNYGKAVKVWSAGLIFSVAASFVSAGPIATMDLTYKGVSEGSRSGWIYNDDDSAEVAAGMFGFHVENVIGDDPLSLKTHEVLDAFCVDITTNLQTSGSIKYSLVEAGQYFGNADKADKIGRLYTAFSGSINGSDGGVTSAAFQLALWEIINETLVNDKGEQVLFLSNGSFSSTAFKNSNDTSSARSIADDWMTGLGSIVNGFDMFVLESARDG